MDRRRPAPCPGGGCRGRPTIHRRSCGRSPARSGRPRRSIRPGYNRALAHRVTLIPGDGIGPELAEATRRVLDATGIAFEWEVVDAGEGRDGRVRHAALRTTSSVDQAQQGRPQGADHDPGPRRVSRSVNVTLRQVLGLYANLRPARSIKGLGPVTRTSTSSSSGRTPRTCTPAEHGQAGRGEHQDHHPHSVRADRPVRVRIRGRERPAQGHRSPWRRTS